MEAMDNIDVIFRDGIRRAKHSAKDAELVLGVYSNALWKASGNISTLTLD